MYNQAVVASGPPGYPGTLVAEPAGIWSQLKRRKTVFAVGATTVAALVIVAYLVLPKSYMAVAAVTVSPPQQILGPSAPGELEKLGDEADLQTQILVISSPRLLGQILTSTDIAGALRNECEVQQSVSWPARIKNAIGLGCNELLGTSEAGVEWLKQHLSVSVVGRSRVIDIGYHSVVPQVAARVANALTTAYLEDKKAEVSGSREAAVRWLRAELTGRGNNLRDAEVAVENYRHAHGLERGQIAPISSEQLSQLAKEVAAAEARKADAAAALEQLGSDPKNLDRAFQSAPVLNSRTISELRVRQAAIGAQIAHLAATWGSRSAVLTSLQQQEASIVRQIQDETARIAASIRQQYAHASQEVATLDLQLDVLKRNVGNAGDAEAAMSAMVQSAQVQREIYLDLAKKANDLETQRRVMTGDAELVNYAEIPINVWFPKAVIFGAVGLVLALGSGTGAAILWDRNDQSVRATGTLSAAMGTPVLARIPEAPLSTDDVRLSCLGTKPSALQDAIRTLYASCLLLPRGEEPRTVLVTSSEPDEGKTFITLNLAAFAATAGKRVLVIENDMRQPSIGRTLRLQPGKGLADLLCDKASFKDVLVRDERNGFDVIPAGRPVLNSTELAASIAMQRLIETAVAQYDLVLFDSPPSLVMMDARLLVSQMDRVLFCARWGFSPMATVAEGIKGVQDAGGRVAGLVLNRVRPSEYRLYESVSEANFEAYISPSRT
jgi:capsular exopolysaccharide synthesis family protein